MKKVLLSLIAFSILCSASVVLAATEKQKSNNRFAEARQNARLVANVVKTGSYNSYAVNILKEFNENSFGPLDAFYTSLQSAYEAGLIDDLTLEFAFRPVFSLSAAKDAAGFAAWEEKFPRSYAARLAHAEYDYQVGFAARGHAFIDKTSQGKQAAFANWFGLAARKNAETYSLAKKPILSVALDVELLKAADTDKQAVQNAALTILGRGNAMDPQNFIVRNNIIYLFKPRWFGSDEIMKQVADNARRDGLEKTKADYLDAMVDADAVQTAHDKADYATEEQYGMIAIPMQARLYDYGYGLDTLQYYIVAHAKHYRHEHGNIEPSDPFFMQALQLAMTHADLMVMPGWYFGEYAQVRWNVGHDVNEAFENYKRGAAYGDGHSLYNVARIYCHGQPGLNVPLDRKLCLENMGKAAQAGYPSAVAEMKDLVKP